MNISYRALNSGHLLLQRCVRHVFSWNFYIKSMPIQHLCASSSISDLDLSLCVHFLTDNASSGSFVHLPTHCYQMVGRALGGKLSILQAPSSPILHPTNLFPYGHLHCDDWILAVVRTAKWRKSFTTIIRFANCYFNYGPDQETIEYVQPFLEEEFTGEGDGFIGALYYVRPVRLGENYDLIQSVEGEFRMRAFLATMGFNSIMAACSSVIVSCSYLIVAHFRWEIPALTVPILKSTSMSGIN